jgi:hypothetical protein
MRIFIGAVGFWFWGSIVEVVRKAITFPSERFANGTAKLNGLDESVSIAGGTSEVLNYLV